MTLAVGIHVCGSLSMLASSMHFRVSGATSGSFPRMAIQSMLDIKPSDADQLLGFSYAVSQLRMLSKTAKSSVNNSTDGRSRRSNDPDAS